MKFNYKLHRLCGVSYGSPNSVNSTSGNILYTSSGNVILSPVSNRIQVIDLLTQSVKTLSFEARSNIRTIALSKDDRLLLVIDDQNHALLVNFHRSIVLHRFTFKRPVRVCEFSPCGRFFAVSFGKHVQIWYSPGLRREFAPFVLHRTYTGLTDHVMSICWSSDSSVIMASSKDGTARIWTVQSVSGYIPVTLSAHKTAVVAAYFDDSPQDLRYKLRTVYTVSSDGAVVTWRCTYTDEKDSSMDIDQSIPKSSLEDGTKSSSLTFFTSNTLVLDSSALVADGTSQADYLPHATWKTVARHYFNQNETHVTATSYCPTHRLLVVGFSSGLFGLYELPSMSNIHTLSISNQVIRTVSINKSGEWLAFGCPSTQQLLVWEWRSETYIIKQRGHAYGMRCMAYSPDGIVIATGGEDGSIKMWNSTSGFCYCTFKSHTAPVTSVCFANSSVVISSSLDGTVRAHDLHRYRNFKTYTSPTPSQFTCLAVDPAGEIITAGSMDPFHVYVWNLQTAKLLDVLSGHTGPVSELAFHPVRGTLASASWDGTVKIWDLYKREGQPESIKHLNDVVCCAFRPDGLELCTGTIGGLLCFWSVEDCLLLYEIDGKRDITGGRKLNDRMTSDNNAASRYFTSVCYSADGSCVLAGGNSKYVCIYECSQRLLIKKFQVSFNRSLDGVLDELNSKNLADGGPIDAAKDSDDEADFSFLLPGAKRGDDGSRTSKVEVLVSKLSFSSSGKEWALVSNEGLHIYSLDDEMIFDPISLTEEITPGAVQLHLSTGNYAVALIMSLHLNEFSLVKQVVEATPFRSIAHVVRTVGPEHLEHLIQYLSKVLDDSPHLEFYVQWCLEVLQTHGSYMENNRGRLMRAFRVMLKSLQSRYDELKNLCDANSYTLAFTESQATMMLES